MAQTTNAPYIDSPAAYGFTFGQPQTVALGFIDGGTVLAPQALKAAADSAVLTVKASGVAVADTAGRSFRDALDQGGAFRFTIPRDLPPSVDFDEIVTFEHRGREAFAGIIADLDHVALTRGEEADETVTVSGPGVLQGILGKAVVYPSRGVEVEPIEEVRSFSWPSVDFDTSAWPNAKRVNRRASYADTGAPLPHVFPNIDGWWIWGNRSTVTALDAPQGICLFAKTFTLAADATVRFFCAFDDVGRIYLDGAEMTWFSGKYIGRYIEVALTAGDHKLAAKVANKTDVPGEDNPGGFILAGYTINATGLLDTLVVETDTTWDCLPYPVRAPGFTHGEVLRLLLEEAQAVDNGGSLLSDVTLGFTDALDSNGNPWGYYREVTAEVGRSIYEVARELSESYIDVAMTSALVLRAWDSGDTGPGRGTATAVELEQTTDPATSDFLQLRHQGRRVRMNDALIRYEEGWIQETDTASLTASGLAGGFLSLGAVRGEAEARRVAQAVMTRRVEPSYATTATIAPSASAKDPYVGFQVGDTITAPDETDTPATVRVRAISLREEGELVSWDLELRDQVAEEEERFDNWLRRTADGFMIGGARVSSRTGGSVFSTAQIVALRVAEFSYDNVQLTVSTSPRRPADQSGNIVEVVGELTTAGTTTTTVLVKLNGSTIATLTFASGVTEDSVAIDIEPVLANVDKLQCEITAAGTGAEGLDVQVRAI